MLFSGKCYSVAVITCYLYFVMTSEPKNEKNISLRARKKAATLAKVIEISHHRFHEKGFDSTTIDEICDAAMISKRTFFRYFKDKESLIFPQRDERLAQFTFFLSANIKEPNPFDVLRSATSVLGRKYNENKYQILHQQRLIRSSNVLQDREREIDQDWEHEIANAFAKRAGRDPKDDLWAQVLAGAIMGVVRSTVSYWFEHGCEEDLISLGQHAIHCLEQGFPISPTEVEE
jgi:AcrR family transcriptional regulator